MLKNIVMFCMLAAVPTARTEDKSSRVVCSIEQGGTILECNYPTPEKPSYVQRLFAAENLPNLLLVGVGIAGIISAVATFKVIKRQAVSMRRQTKQMRIAAEATLTQVLFQQESLRPRLSVSGFKNDVFEEAVHGKRIFIGLQISNSGGMPAYAVVPETWIEFIERGSLERPFQFSTKAIYNKAAPINVDTGSPQGFEIPFNRRLSDQELLMMQEAKGTVCFRIRLTYSAFNNEHHFDHAFAIAPGAAESIAEYTSAN